MSRIVSILLIFLSYSIFSQKNLINVDSIIKTDNYNVIKNIEYGEAERNVLDLWIANKNKNSPLMIFIHGGGFGSGSKESAYSKNNFKRVEKMIENGISFATINYRFKNDNDGILISLNDAKEHCNFFVTTAINIKLINQKLV